MIKNHTIKSFKVSKETWDKFQQAVEGTGLKSSQLSRLLFNRALSQLMSRVTKTGWDDLEIQIKEL